MTESRTPPKFVPTLTEVAVQDVAPALEENSALARDQSAPEAIESIASEPLSVSGLDVLRRRREAAGDVESPAMPALDIANLPTHSGWAQPVDGLVLPMGVESLAEVAVADVIDTDHLVAADPLLDVQPGEPERTAASAPPASLDALPVLDTEVVDPPLEPWDEEAAAALPAAQSAAAVSVAHVEGVVDGPPLSPASDAATASLVASAAQTAQELEDAITRRVLKRVQDTLDARLNQTVLQVIDQQTALFQSSLQLEIDSTIREAVADAVAKVLKEQGGKV